ncbi:MAG: chromosomal replication initiator protein DnaA [Pigeon pea little leaf phytoplasma]|uniref:Chromosomal replication initiator protein DnaA n=1 Tax=Candidatus Phytoplasma fabacearum TaxID=2982628 RepID=A0ABU8ZS92_9MOLU|nr:chromosomal replication initiator protein DnaA ['Bituminaria bituminosa' little leaf phytoplasma]MDV3158084.1 chromosomal replication initiator protein DnaA [Pigeon pea little leaf phytoplasma]MDO8023901.1 chromosomal replication initiator protein DnaA ['Bituminaria bituminosa' little leaf phytoplasma]MDV3158552.1 chromosomal replication initiator protein DnaA [Pigeon pea little leaf phytoplasma]MDV3161438.1 chromosomal replication initiator protein DnaA [Pigeon pea little leaf phytoplasma]
MSLSVRQVLDKVVEELSLRCSPEVFKANFINMKNPYKIEKNTIFILVSDFIKTKIILMNYLDLINEISKKYSDNDIFFKFLSDKDLLTNSDKSNIIDTNNSDNFDKNKSLNIDSFDLKEFNLNYNDNYSTGLEAKYNFDNFVIGESNDFTFRIAKKTANEEILLRANPLYIFGDVGLGKTHLMHAIGNFMIQKNTNKKILYVKAEGFMEEFTSKLKQDKMDEFHFKYRNLDVLLIDDIQMMENAKYTQIEFFKLFDHLNSQRKQIVITSDKPVTQLKKIMGRLTNRFQSGLVGDIKKPDQQHCLRIIQKKLLLMPSNLRNKLNKEVLYFISSHFGDNIRELEGVLLRLLNYTQIYGFEMNLTNSLIALEPLLKNKNNISPEENDIRKIQKVVSRSFNIKVSDLNGHSRDPQYSLPRDIAIYLIKKRNKISNEMIGFLFNKRHYSTISKSYQRIKNKIKVDQNLEQNIQKIMLKLNNDNLALEG